MDARDFSLLLRSRLESMRRNRPQEVLTIAQELKTAVQLRIQTTGTNASGQAFIGYSPAYKQVRAERGRRTDKVDFTFTGAMWNNIRAVVTENGEDFTVVVTGAQSADNKAKLYGALRQPAAKPRGKILLPDKSEIALAAEANKRRQMKYLKP